MSWTSDTATDFADLLVRLDAFLVDHGHSLPPIYTGTGTGRVSQVLGTATTVQETITVQFTTSTAYAVTGSVAGAMGAGTVGTAFVHSRLSFLVSAGDTAWVAGDTISWIMTPPLTRCRLRGAAAWIAGSGFDVIRVTDGDTASYVSIAANLLPQQAGMKLLKAEEIRSVRLRLYNSASYGPSAYSVEYSDTGADGSWTAAASFTAQTWSSAYEIRTHDIPACGTHLYWRLNLTAANNGYCQLSELTFYTGTAASNPLPWYGDAIWCAPGNGAQDQIYIGAGLQWNSVGAYWCWRLGGMIGYVEANAFTAQPGFFGASWMTLWNSPIPYWFIADGKSVKVVAKISTQYEQCYLGFLDCYMAPGNYPYPLVVGGSMAFQYRGIPALTSSAYRYSDTSENHRAWWTPGGDGNYGHTNYDYGHLLQRKVDASVIAYQGINGNSNTPFIWPYGHRAGSSDVNFQDVRLNLDGSVPLFPIVFHDPTPNCYGEPDGVMAIHGNNQSVENIITNKRIDWLVVQNVMRVGANDYAAYRLS